MREGGGKLSNQRFMGRNNRRSDTGGKLMGAWDDDIAFAVGESVENPGQTMRVKMSTILAANDVVKALDKALIYAHEPSDFIGVTVFRTTEVEAIRAASKKLKEG